MRKQGDIVVLEKVNDIDDVRELSLDEKKKLCDEIRNYILQIVSKNGGHLASNLGIVELTIALESVFHPLKDKIIWDVGHQCYVHKILNGRKNELKKIRTIHGISGFPKVKESLADCFNTGHSSTSISAALGMAKARNIKNQDYHVIAVIGDGALTGGMALEALNHVGCTQTKMIIVLNDNEMSISKNISGMNTLLTKLRSRKNYRKTNSRGRKMISSIPAVGKVITEVVSRGKNAVKQVFIPGMYFEEIGIKYLGPVDGHNIEEMERLFERAKDFDEPVLIHVLTKKGKGYLPAEKNPSLFHGVGPFDIQSGKVSSSLNTYSHVFGDTLIQLSKKNKRIVAITAAMKDGVGLAAFAKKYPNRFFDVGIAEEHALTFAAGLASEGMIPFVSIYSSFYQRAYDQVIHDICLQNLPVVMCVDRAGLVGADGETHQGLYDMAFFRIVPNLVIMAPKDFAELKQMMEFAITLNRPVIIRYPRGGESSFSMKRHALYFGKGELLEKGTDMTIIGIGNSVSKGIELHSLLQKKGISSEVINVRFIKPFDYHMVIKSIQKTKHVVVIEDGTIVGGLSSIIKELLVDYSLDSISSYYYALPDEFIPHGSVSELEKKYHIDVDSIYHDLLDKFIKK